MSKATKPLRMGWRSLWCVPQRSRQLPRAADWNGLELNAIGSAWGRDRNIVSGIDGWSATIVAELTR